MMTNKNHTVLYVGVTNDIVRRVYEHKKDLVDGFTKKYKCHKLVWFDETDDVTIAIKREKQMKKWKRAFKNNLINEKNPIWRDLYYEMC
jgi:putative endonuclease